MAVTFRDLIAANKRKSFLLVGLFCLFSVVVSLVLALGILVYLMPEAALQVQWQRGLLIAALVAGTVFFLSLLSYYGGDKLILAISRAHPIQHQDDPELFNVVEEMAIAAGVPMPKVYLIYDSAPNAFATGRDPQHAAIAITSGLRTLLGRDELQGVVAHEMSHIRNYDIRLMLVLAVLIGTIVMLADFFWQIVRFQSEGSRSTERRSERDKGGGLLAGVLFIVALILASVAPLLAQLIQLAVSRQREYLADASAVELTRYPQGLASALRKIDEDPAELKTANRGTAHLFIANPIKRFADRASTIWSSHPPIKERIARLQALVQ